ncbi:MAG: hypothetical protein KA792_10290, partial [Bacteroidales bacterium]|nr:hypothetical protein [Bacteroidales bacterium]
MNKNLFSKLFPHIIAVLLFIILSFIFFYPVLEGKKLRQGDIINHKGMSKEITDFREKTGKEPLWTNSMFGGMPAYQISVKYHGNLMWVFDKIFTLSLPHPANLFFLYLVGFYLLLLVLGVNPWLSIAGAFAYSLSTYFLIIIEAGHNSKVHAIGYIAPVIASVILTYKGRYLLGSVLFALFLALELYTGHPQISYYMFIIILFIGAAELYKAIKDKLFKTFFKASAFIFVAGMLAVLPNITNLWATFEYGKYTTRGKSELTDDKHNKTSGLDKDYATDWSYGIAETFTLMIPNAKGGASAAIGNDEYALKNVDEQYKETVANNGNRYWGNQPFTSGPVYAGAVIIFLFILSLFVVKGAYKWALLGVTLLSILLAWGNNLMWFSDFFLTYVPYYNKFRAVSTTLVIAEFTIPLLAILGLAEIIRNQQSIKKQIPNIQNPIPNTQNSILKAVYISFGLTGGLCLLFYLLPEMFFGFMSNTDIETLASQKQQYPNYADQLDSIFRNIELARIAIFRLDAIRSFFFILLAASFIWLFVKKKMNLSVLTITLIAIILLDMVIVNKRYISENSFVESYEMETPFVASQADEVILKDKTPGIRVLNLAANTFNDASTSYFHKSIGGYHGAKFKRYQELIEKNISKEMMMLRRLLSDSTVSYSSIDMMMSKFSVLNMLNTKYIIYSPKAPPLSNRYNFGAAWFVPQYKLVENADNEIAALNNTDLKNTAIIDKRFNDRLKGYVAVDNDSLAFISLKEYMPNYLVYQ